MITLGWANFKSLLTENSLECAYYDSELNYYVYPLACDLEFLCIISKQSPPSLEQIDFETNYKDISPPN